MEFYLFLEKILDNIWLNIFIYVVFVLGYLSMFRNRIWSFADPLFIGVISAASAAYCVYILTFYKLIKTEYSIIFLLTELSFLIGFFIVKNTKNVNVTKNETINFNYKELQIFVWSAATVYFFSQITTFVFIGFVLFKQDTNHLFAFENHSVLRVFLTYSRTIFLIAVFYKRLIKKKFFTLEKVLIMFTIISTILGGSKSALINFFSLYIVVDFIYNKRIGNTPFKFNKYVMPTLILSAVFIISIQSNSGFLNSLTLLYYRSIGSGDIFVLGYNENVINSIHEKSGLKYIFYPGIGTVLKLVSGMEAPHIVGVDITEYYTGKTDSGPNARHNFIGMIFWGYGGIFFSFICGFLISWVRNNLIFIDKKSNQFIYFIIISLVVYLIPDLASDANLFMNNIVWSLFMLLIIYLISSFFSSIFFLNFGINNTTLVEC